ncbi:MAG: hypothetical protein D6707_04885 [Bacteroidetes bacterium]|nr:MAG: hypothetical protein D6707_04885 [Bacteroidota bacterium]
MVLHYIFFLFFLIAFVFALLQFFINGNTEIFNQIVDSTFEMSKVSVDISIYLIGVMTLWLGFMNIGEKGGAVQILAKIVAPFFKRIFPEIPKNHPVMGSILMNFSANMLGLDNAATPLGIKAMEELQELNPKKDTASNAQIMFLVLNTSGLTLIPVSILAIRAAEGAQNPAEVFIPILLATFCSSMAGLIFTSIAQKINLFNKVVLAYLISASLIIAGIITYFTSLSPEDVKTQSALIGNGILFSVIIFFLTLGYRKKIDLFSTFIEGAKEGFSIAVKIIPYLVGMLVAIGVFRTSGALSYLISGIEKLFLLFNLDTEFVKALPVAFMKPLSGSGARAMMVEVIHTYGVDSFAGKLAATFQGTTETTFYTLAVYFGAVGVKNTRNAVPLGLLADLAGIIAAIFISYIFFS